MTPPAADGPARSTAPSSGQGRGDQQVHARSTSALTRMRSSVSRGAFITAVNTSGPRRRRRPSAPIPSAMNTHSVSGVVNRLLDLPRERRRDDIEQRITPAGGLRHHVPMAVGRAAAYRLAGLERGDDLRRRPESIGRRLLQAARDHHRPGGRHVLDPRPRVGGASLSSTRATVAERRRRGERMHAARVFVQQHAEREDVGARVDRQAVDLLRRHVGRRADQHAGQRHRAAPRRDAARRRFAPGRSRESSGGRRASRMTFSGLRSRCVMPFACALASAVASSRAVCAISVARGRRRPPISSRSVWPSTNSAR